MKLSEMSTEKAADALMLLAPEIQPLLLDAQLMSELRKGTKDKDKAVETGAMKLATLVPVILGKYRPNVFRILAALNDKTPEEIAAQNVLVTIRQLKEMIRDKELLDFFTPSVPSARNR